jgi:hypothetical protein
VELPHPAYPTLERSRRYLSVRPVLAADHTMGEHLPRYVLPKVPAAELTACRGRALVYAGTDLDLLADAGKYHSKSFNWRRPVFIENHGMLQCFTPPGRDYTYHYAGLLAAACVMIEQPVKVEVELPAVSEAAAFIERWLPPKLPAFDVVVLGYVQHLFPSTQRWTMEPGFGWSWATVAACNVGLIGCEFSYWGDLAGALVSALARRGTSWVIYVGKLGALSASHHPNRWIATGTNSWVEGRHVAWRSRLQCDPDLPGLLLNQTHVTVPSILDETLAWHSDAVHRWDLVDPEIGRMADAAVAAGIQFDYLHIVSDSLAGTHPEGLYDERSTSVAAARRTCLTRITTILERSINS